MQARTLACAAAVALVGADAMAARPFVTDDARIVDPGGCQIESFVKRSSDASEFWFVPGCNPLGRVELTAAGVRTWPRAGDSFGTLIAQAKMLLQPLRTDGTGFALTVGSLRHSAAARWNPFLNGIVSHAFAGDRWVVHANAGVLQDREASRSLHTWGIGAELALGPRWSAIAETYGQELDPVSRQLGLRYWIVPNRLQLDSTLGSQHSVAWISLGMRILF